MATNCVDTNATVDLESGLEELDLDERKKEEMKNWLDKRGSMQILITGRRQTGKSTLVNALVGKKLAETGSDLKVTTKSVIGYEMEREGMKVVVWDSPGLEDNSGDEEQYLREMKENCSNVDIVIYCLDVSAARAQLGGAEKDQMKDLCAIKTLTKIFGREWCGHSIFVLTRANALATMFKDSGDESKFKKRLKDWEGRIHAALKEEGVSSEVVKKVPVKPAGHPKQRHLPGNEYWLSALWFAITQRAKDESQSVLVDLESSLEELTLDERKKEEMKNWLEKRGSMQILITGRTGTGKSTLVNALVGKKLADTGGDLSVNTKYVTGYNMETNEGMKVVVWDSPGLEDNSGDEDRYLREMEENCSNVDIVIYCLDVSAARAQLGGAEKDQMKDFCAIKKLTEKFGHDWWGHSIFVLTRANTLETQLNVGPGLESKFRDRLKDWERRIHAALKEEGVPSEVVKEVPVKPAGYPKKPHLPGNKYWLSALWFSFTKRAKDESQSVYMNQHRFKEEKDITAEDFKKAGHDQPIVVKPIQKGYVRAMLARFGIRWN